MNTPHAPTRRRSPFSLPAALALGACLLAGGRASAQTTLYWTRATPTGGTQYTWATGTSGNVTNWAADAVSPPTLTWTNEDAANIVTANALIYMGGTAPIAASLTVQNGMSLAAGSTSNGTGLVIDGSGGATGGGNFAIVDNTGFSASNSFLVRLQSTNASDTGFNGTITVNSLTVANGSAASGYTSGLTLGSNTYVAGNNPAFTGTGVNTSIVLNGGNLSLGIGLAVTAAQTTQIAATVGSLSGTGNIGFQGVYSSTASGGTRTLVVNQSATTSFSGVIGSSTTTQTADVFALTKSGTGTLTINASAGSGYGGTTAVQAGRLNLNGTLGATDTAATSVNQGGFTVANGATLGLTGTLNTTGTANITVASGGALTLGLLTITSPATTVTTKGLVFSGAATVSLQVGGTSSLVTLANASMNGSAAGGAGSILLNITNGGGAAAGTTYNLIDFGGTTQGIPLADFALAPGSLGGSLGCSLGYGGDGNELQFTLSAVPEPSTAIPAALLALWLGWKICRHARWRSANHTV